MNGRETVAVALLSVSCVSQDDRNDESREPLTCEEAKAIALAEVEKRAEREGTCAEDRQCSAWGPFIACWGDGGLRPASYFELCPYPSASGAIVDFDGWERRFGPGEICPRLVSTCIVGSDAPCRPPPTARCVENRCRFADSGI